VWPLGSANTVTPRPPLRWPLIVWPWNWCASRI